MKKITIFLFSIFLFIACDDSNLDNMAPTLDEVPISTWLSENPEEFSEWVALLKYTDLYNAMNLNTQYTAFVPTDSAMNVYLTAKGYSSVEAMSKEDASLLVKYHTIKGKAYAQNEFGDGILPDTTASGDYLTINFIGSEIYVNGESTINQVDVAVTNGVLHTLNGVLDPITETIWDRINTSEFSIMAEAISMTGYDEMLVKIRDGKQKFQYTLFAVPNSVYAQNEINSVQDLIGAIGVSNTDYTDYENELNVYIAYHIFDSQLDYSSLATFTDEELTKNIAPLAPNQLINVSDQNSALYLNYNTETEEGISIVEGNVNTKNGLIHMIDDPMFLFVPDVATVIWELTDYPALSGIVNDYRSTGLRNNSSTTLSSTEEKIDFYRWETATTDYMNSSVTYIAYGVNDIRSEFLNTDGLNLQLRLYGWIEMNTPTIVEGTYTVNIKHYSPLGTSKTGLATFSFDGNFVGGQVTLNGNSTTRSEVITTTIGTITFDTTSSHAMRILQGDGNTIQLDYIEFIPVK